MVRKTTTTRNFMTIMIYLVQECSVIPNDSILITKHDATRFIITTDKVVISPTIFYSTSWKKLRKVTPRMDKPTFK